MEVPAPWRDYKCDDYFASRHATEGLWDEAAQVWLVEPVQRVEELDEEFLQVGRPGVDGIAFGYRKGQPGFWAFHQTADRRFQYLAPTLLEFVEAWYSRTISL